jgi:hypothetical protein
MEPKVKSKMGLTFTCATTGVKRIPSGNQRNTKKITIGTIQKAVKQFLDGRWSSKSSTFYICFQTDIQDTKIQDELERQRIALNQRAIGFIPLGAVEMSRRLKSRPEIVDDFFGRDWTIEFCGADAARKFSNRLDAAAVARLRKELLNLYSSNFSSIDPGIASAFPLGAQQQLSLLNRFIEPDVTFEDTLSISGEN